MSKVKFPQTIIVTRYDDGDEELCVDEKVEDVELGGASDCAAAVYMLASRGDIFAGQQVFRVSPPKGALSRVH
jgi:hypothetical protein